MSVASEGVEGFGSVAVEGGDATWRFAASGAIPSVVARPTSVGQVVELVRGVAKSGKALVPVGGGARLAIGNRPRRYDVALCTSALAEIERHVAEDMTVTVQAGVTLACLNERLAASGQWIPLDPAIPEETTIGGLIASDASGPLRNAHGKVRDFLLGVELVNGLGEVVRGGGRVVKNVAGYDLPKVVCGSFGTLGTIVSATFKTLPTPASQRLYSWVCADMAEASRRAMKLAAEGVTASLLEAVSEGACEGIGLDCPATLAIGVAGSKTETRALDERVRALSGDEAVEWPADKSPVVLKAIRNFSLPISEDAVVGRIAVQPGSLAELFGRIESEARIRGIVLEASAHAAIGVARCQILGAGDPDRCALFAEWLRLAVRERGGWVTYEAMPDELRGRLDAWGFSGPTVVLMRGVKRVFDPDSILSPGRFVGGI